MSENVHERWDARRERVENEMDHEERVSRDVVRGVRALSLAVDTLGRIAEMGGVTGDWSVEALEKISDTLNTGYVPTRAGVRLVQTMNDGTIRIVPPSLRDELDAATGQGRR